MGYELWSVRVVLETVLPSELRARQGARDEL